jgi:hypothetical protein
MSRHDEKGYHDYLVKEIDRLRTWTVTDIEDPHAPDAVVRTDSAHRYFCTDAAHAHGEPVDQCVHIAVAKGFVHESRMRAWGWPTGEEEKLNAVEQSLVDHLGYNLTLVLYVMATAAALGLVPFVALMKRWGWL